jgi:hypothetical protein
MNFKKNIVKNAFDLFLKVSEKGLVRKLLGPPIATV